MRSRTRLCLVRASSAVVACAWLAGLSSCKPLSTVAKVAVAPVDALARTVGLGREPQIVSISPEELQRLVYSSHVLTVIEAKPELEPGLLALLELNPEESSTSLAALVTAKPVIVEPVTEALVAYRKGASRDTLAVRWRDEVMGRYFLKLCEVLKGEEKGSAPLAERRRTVALNLLKVLLAQGNPPDPMGKETVWFHAGGQRLLAVASGPGERRALVERCTRRAEREAGFAAAMDEVLRPEIGLPMQVENPHRAPPDEILKANPALAESPTMKELMRLSSSSEDGSVVITMDRLEGLFQAEIAEMQKAASTAVARSVNTHREIVQAQEEDATRIAAIIQRHAEALAGERKHIAASSAAAMTLSQIVLPKDPPKGRDWWALATNVATIVAGVATVAGAGVGIFVTGGAGTVPAVFAGIGGIYCIGAGVAGLVSWSQDTDGSGGSETKEEALLRAIKLVGQMLSELSTEMHDRFDRVDRSLGAVLDGLRRTVLLIGEVRRDVAEVRRNLLVAQGSLDRLERGLGDYLNAGFARELAEHINGDLGFEARTGEPMTWKSYTRTGGPENKFHAWAVLHASDKLASPPADDDDLKDMNLLAQLRNRPLERNLNYVKEFLRRRLGASSLPARRVASLGDWYAGANAYLRLNAENPQHFRRMSEQELGKQRLVDVIQAGTDLEGFFRAITFAIGDSGLQVNRKLYGEVLSYYEGKLRAFVGPVKEEEALVESRLSEAERALKAAEDARRSAEEKFPRAESSLEVRSWDPFKVLKALRSRVRRLFAPSLSIQEVAYAAATLELKDAQARVASAKDEVSAAKVAEDRLGTHTLSKFDSDLNDSLNELTGAKALLGLVLSLGLPDSLEQDDVLRGYLFGSGSLIDRDGARALYEAEEGRRDKGRKLRAQILEETSKARLERFRKRLNDRLDALEKSGIPEIPRMVSQTLLQLRLLEYVR